MRVLVSIQSLVPGRWFSRRTRSEARRLALLPLLRALSVVSAQPESAAAAPIPATPLIQSRRVSLEDFIGFISLGFVLSSWIYFRRRHIAAAGVWRLGSSVSTSRSLRQWPVARRNWAQNRNRD